MKYLETYRLTNLPAKAYYIPDFISDAEEHFLLQKITNAPLSKWTVLSNRRLQAWPTQLLKGSVLPTTDALPTWLDDPLVQRMVSLDIWRQSPHDRANHCLINEYEPGQGIMPHEDGDVYHPVVATVSLQDGIVLDIYRKTEDGKREIVYRIYQEPKSLLITTEDMYTDYLHGIQDIDVDKSLYRDTVANWDFLSDDTKQRIELSGGDLKRKRARVSLTFRDVKKVRNLAAFLQMK
ncbi:hypothetical protein V1512DRAFT_228116 [Lipomyces arxii]|uniref:uncharacterized protein n=1 Tax=Lipomyces arxii TaxID=56418 RepID=UPI0034CF292D